MHIFQTPSVHFKSICRQSRVITEEINTIYYIIIHVLVILHYSLEEFPCPVYTPQPPEASEGSPGTHSRDGRHRE